MVELVVATLLALTGMLQVRAENPQQSLSQLSTPVIRYTVSLANTSQHLLRIQIDLPPGAAERDLQLPVWYALYQVRDFSQYVNWVRIINSANISILKLDKSRWRITGAEAGAQVEYEIFADNAGPFGAELNSHHAFLNLAEILMYPTDARDVPMQIRFTDVPLAWKIVTGLQAVSDGFLAKNYDELTDSPVEICACDEKDFDEAGGHYRVVVDAASGDYDMNKIVLAIRQIVAAETAWMNDRPFTTYTFIYHFPRGSGGGGMEHANGTAIDISAHTLATDFPAFEGVTAHEFFHLWNVKRIRPQSLEPPDYSKENYTNALWFSEGVTSTVENYALLQAGLLDEKRYIAHLGAAISELENRPARLTQSAEESSTDAWLEKYSYYRGPARSISYYNKGELLGVLLDLKLRESTKDEKSLRDLFQWLNSNYAKQNRFFADSEGLQQAAETITHSDMKPFFEKYIAGTAEIPWNEFFNTVGLQMVTQKISTADVGFTAIRNFDSPLTVIAVEENSGALRAGLAKDDLIVEMNGEPIARNFQETLSRLRPGDRIQLRIRTGDRERELSWTIGSREEIQFQLKDLANLTPQQKERRTAWLKGESEPAGDPHP